MKRIIFFLVCLFSFNSLLKADCTYADKVELNKLSYYVDVNYNYDEETSKFEIVLVNVPKTIYAHIGNNNYFSENDEIHMSYFKSGSNLDIGLYSSNESACSSEYLRSISFRVPYYNSFYGRSECEDYSHLEICTYKFLPYEVTSEYFKQIIDREKEKELESKKDNEEEKTPFLENLKKFGLNIGVPILLVIISGGGTFLITNLIFRKIKHGL